ncbi:MAG: hypothetical protein AAF560_26220 [Acidobacteriota bacterium]
MEDRNRNTDHISDGISGRRLTARWLAVSAAFALTFGTATATAEPRVDVVAEVGQKGSLAELSYSADGRWLMTTDGPFDGTTRLWLDGRLRHVLPGSRGAMTPDGRFVATAGRNLSGEYQEIWLWDVATGQLRWEALAPELRGFAVTSDSTRLIVASDQMLQVWGIETVELLRRLEGEDPGRGQILVSPLGTWVAKRSREVTMIWELETGQARCRLVEPLYAVSGQSFAPREQFFVAAGKGVVKLWDPETCELRHRFETDDPSLGRGLMSSDGAYVLASSSREAWLWHRESGEVVYQVTECDRCKGFSGIAFHPRGDWAAIARSGSRIDLVALETGAPVRTVQSSVEPKWLVPRPDGAELAVVGGSRVDILRLQDGSSRELAQFDPLKLQALHLSQDAEQLVVQNDRFTSLWDLASGGPPIFLEGTRSIASRDGSLVAVGPSDHQETRDRQETSDPSVRIWQRETRRIVAEVAHEGGLTSFALDPSGNVLATGAEDGGVRIWEARTGRLVQELQGPARVTSMVLIEEVSSEEVSSEGVSSGGVSSGGVSSGEVSSEEVLTEADQAIVVGFHDSDLRVWKLGASEPPAVLPHPEGDSIWRLEALPTPGAVLAQFRKGDIYLWNPSQPQLIQQIDQHTFPEKVAATPTGRFAMMDRFRKDLQVWSVESDEALFALEGLTDRVHALAVDLHGDQFLTGDVEGALGLWSTQDGRLKAKHQASPISISAIVPHPEGRFVILGDQDGGLRFWSLAEEREIVRVLMPTEGVWAVLTPDGRWDASGAGRDAGIVAWSGLEPGHLADHPEHYVPGLLAKALRP